MNLLPSINLEILSPLPSPTLHLSVSQFLLRVPFPHPLSHHDCGVLGRTPDRRCNSSKPVLAFAAPTLLLLPFRWLIDRVRPAILDFYWLFHPSVIFTGLVERPKPRRGKRKVKSHCEYGRTLCPGAFWDIGGPPTRLQRREKGRGRHARGLENLCWRTTALAEGPPWSTLFELILLTSFLYPRNPYSYCVPGHFASFLYSLALNSAWYMVGSH